MKNFDNIDVSQLTNVTMKYASEGMIDATHNLLHDRVYIFDGLNDTAVMPGHSHCVNDRLSAGSNTIASVRLSVCFTLAFEPNDL